MSDRIKAPAAFWLGVDRLGIRRSALLRAAELPAEAGQDNRYLTTAQFFALWRGLEALHGPDVRLQLSQALDGSVMPPSLLVAYHARGLGDALDRVARFKALCAPEEISVSTDGQTCIIESTWSYGGATPPAALSLATMASLVDLARTGSGEDVRPVRVELQGGPSEAIAAHFRCPIRWKADRDRLILLRSDLQLPFQTYNRELLDLLDGALAPQAEARNASLAEQVRWLLRRSLTAGRPELRSVARELAISERSLQRRLGEEGHSFQSLLSDTRHALACEYLAQAAFDIAEIAYMLGYDDPGSFYRAFQQWEGKTPSQWREQSAVGPAPTD
jgi:AraC-like DNA-binding protein